LTNFIPAARRRIIMSEASERNGVFLNALAKRITSKVRLTDYRPAMPFGNRKK